MKKIHTIYILAGIFIVSIILSSCTIEKRQYRAGYFIINKNGKNITKRGKNKNDSISCKKNSTENLEITIVPKKINTGMSFYDNKPIVIKEKNEQLLLIEKKILNQQNNEDSCAIIYLKNGENIEAIILEVSSKEIKYKKCGRTNTPIYIIDNSEVREIEYPDGTFDIINSPKNINDDNNYRENNTQEDKEEKDNRRIRGLIALITGCIFTIAAIFIVLFVSLITGTILCVGGVILQIIGGALIRKSKRKKKEKENWERNNETIF